MYRSAVKRIDMSFCIVDLAKNRWHNLIELQGETDNGDVSAVFSYCKKAVGDKRVEQLYEHLQNILPGNSRVHVLYKNQDQDKDQFWIIVQILIKVKELIIK